MHNGIEGAQEEEARAVVAPPVGVAVMYRYVVKWEASPPEVEGLTGMIVQRPVLIDACIVTPLPLPIGDGEQPVVKIWISQCGGPAFLEIRQNGIVKRVYNHPFSMEPV